MYANKCVCFAIWLQLESALEQLLQTESLIPESWIMHFVLQMHSYYCTIDIINMFAYKCNYISVCFNYLDMLEYKIIKVYIYSWCQWYYPETHVMAFRVGSV